jgi:hypothetical protein
VSLGSLIDSLSPHARLISALLPILIAVVVRFLFGGSRLTNTMVTVATVWFTVNVLAAPYSFQMQQDIESVRQVFR